MGNTGLLRRKAEMTLLTTTFMGNETPRTQEFTFLAFLLVQVSTCKGGRRLPPQKRHL